MVFVCLGCNVSGTNVKKHFRSLHHRGTRKNAFRIASFRSFSVGWQNWNETPKTTNWIIILLSFVFLGARKVSVSADLVKQTEIGRCCGLRRPRNILWNLSERWVISSSDALTTSYSSWLSAFQHTNFFSPPKPPFNFIFRGSDCPTGKWADNKFIWRCRPPCGRPVMLLLSIPGWKFERWSPQADLFRFHAVAERCAQRAFYKIKIYSHSWMWNILSALISRECEWKNSRPAQHTSEQLSTSLDGRNAIEN